MRSVSFAHQHGMFSGAIYQTAYHFRPVNSALPKIVLRNVKTLLLLHHTQLDLASGPLGVLDIAYLHMVIKAIGYVLDADCELM